MKWRLMYQVSILLKVLFAPATNISDGQEKKRFEVKKWTAVAFWSWNMVVETCAICRNHLMEPCIDCQPNSTSQSNIECATAWGTCNHAFHMHCITRWLKTRNVCPLDNGEWVLQKYGN
ncbi:RING finger containing subunit of Skp1-Cullin-F-box ubiquitin protein ligases (SCF) [Komagataella phaffii GS115]|uniref:RING finger containing subunit of Skp1-Cullin-F-box ubiquitin protein ligases (SCF) n=1 Tax=Komagataella phaffii (strain GS115 / ATCC 20864) TaxID=644223 RepID=C4R7W2_KOMPG|nr:RING finger containing subunit of Skp1-Cullin-F-box ubiquitin protein ligases (SCF) [Komagataella phaffii GS115]CAY71687.1 RING finger containing subunit of Skp1-Cullin-F-box ubiquitin protein ligases (SCF) [Komagataella phaffii GS115]